MWRPRSRFSILVTASWVRRTSRANAPRLRSAFGPASSAVDLARHVGNCGVKVDASGLRVVKEHKMSKNRIDLAVAAIMAHSVAVKPKPAPPQMFVCDE